MTDNDTLQALLQADKSAPLGPPPQSPKRPQVSGLPFWIVFAVCAVLVATPVILALTGDPSAVLLGIVTGDPTALLGGPF